MAATFRACRLAAVLFFVATTVAQPTGTSSAAAASAVDLTATEQDLWVLHSTAQRSLVYHRRVTEPFHATAPLNAHLVTVAAAPGMLYAFEQGGGLWSLTSDDWTRELDLPNHALPDEVVGGATGLYALVPVEVARDLPRLVNGARPAASQPFDPGTARLAVVRYDSQGWAVLAACPPALTSAGPLAPHLGLVREVVQLFWAATDGQHIASVRFAGEDGSWRPAGLTPEIVGLRQFWITTASRVPTLIAAVTGTTGGDDLVAFRAFGDADGLTEWRAAPLQLSPLPADVQVDQYHAACGFNQHVALLMSGRPEKPCLRFGRVDDAEAEPTVLIADIINPRDRETQFLPWLQGATLVVLCAVLLSLFLFRRGSLVATIALPPELACALAMQRLLAWIIDFAPFALVAAAVMGVDWQTALQQLSSWAAGTGASGGKPPGPAAMWWWGVSCGAQSAYALVMELFLQRTLGKLLVGTRVLAESGGRPRWMQIVVRNLVRFLELLPPLWLLGFLVLLSRNRQRLGDIFARTLVVRRVRTLPPRRED